MTCTNETRIAFGLEALPPEHVKLLIGRPARDLFADSVDDPHLLVQDFRKRLGSLTPGQTKAFPCVPATLSALEEEGWELAVATNKPTDLANLVLSSTGLAHFFTRVCGADGVAAKPDPATVLRALSSTTWVQAVMVGDSTMDVEAGIAAGVRTVAVLTGSHSREALEVAGPDATVRCLCELRDCLD